jgi:hypothetical protein
LGSHLLGAALRKRGPGRQRPGTLKSLKGRAERAQVRERLRQGQAPPGVLGADGAAAGS